MNNIDKIKKFQCIKCGKCCKNLKQVNENIPYKGLLIFEWEAHILTQKAQDLGIKISILTGHSFYDQKSNQLIVLHWVLNHENCPFLSERNECLIYEDRPLICKLFPIENSGLFERAILNQPLVRMDLMGCSQKEFFSKLKEEIGDKKTFEEASKRVYEVFGEHYLASLQFDLVNYWIHEQVKEMEAKRLIKILRQGNEIPQTNKFEGVLRIMLNTDHISWKKMDDRMTEFRSLYGAIAQIKHILGQTDK